MVRAARQSKRLIFVRRPFAPQSLGLTDLVSSRRGILELWNPREAAKTTRAALVFSTRRELADGPQGATFDVSATPPTSAFTVSDALGDG